ncbi:MAG: malto-oligosyltrehalose synthase [Candidatus Korobacteraceae bacterium]
MIPSSTYRLQLHSGFTLDDASGVADYLAQLGVSHVYASPYLQAAPGSTHGYDVSDHHAVGEELGGEEAHQRFCRHLGECGLGQVLDIVPNHMSLAPNNRYWWDVLENGASSRYAEYFDIDWEPAEIRLSNKVLLPILEDQYGVVLAERKIELVNRIRDLGRFEVHYASHSLPISPESISAFLYPASQACGSDTLAFLSDAFAHLGQPDAEDRASILKRDRDKAVLYLLLERDCNEFSEGLRFIDKQIADLNRDGDAMDAFLQQQNYRLAYWRVSDQDLSYRRFFDINSLISLRVERERVFMETHERILRWLRDGVVDGVRVDHADGLRDPQQYFERLRRTAPNAWVVAEKILQPGEALPASWQVHGTTGYEFLNQVNGLLISADGLNTIDGIYREFTGEATDFDALAHEKKLAVTQEAMGSDINRLTSLFVEICENDREHRDYTRADIRRAIREVAACFPVYRTYVSPERSEASPEDVAVIEAAVHAASEYRTDIDERLFEFIGDVLSLRHCGSDESEFLLRFQQFTGPVMAKGVEDTALYCYNRLAGLNEVGSDPAHAALSVAEFHQLNGVAQQQQPHRMVTLTTHDTKRSEDVRARLAVLTEVPECFRSTIQRWRQRNEPLRRDGVPGTNTEYLYYQTLIGAWPIELERASAYMLKAVREAKQETSWTDMNSDYEDALHRFVQHTLEDADGFVTEVGRFVAHIQSAGRMNSLAQTLLKYTVPGIPDLYQGSELWDHRLVDPDNRSPVRFDLRKRLLDELDSLSPREILQRMPEGLPKLWTIRQAHRVRRERAASFGEAGAYTPILAEGPGSDNIVAFLRGEDIVAVVPRLSKSLTQGWRETTIPLPQGRWRNRLASSEFQGGTVTVFDILSEFPVALLTRES